MINFLKFITNISRWVMPNKKTKGLRFRIRHKELHYGDQALNSIKNGDIVHLKSNNKIQSLIIMNQKINEDMKILKKTQDLYHFK